MGLPSDPLPAVWQRQVKQCLGVVAAWAYCWYALALLLPLWLLAAAHPAAAELALGPLPGAAPHLLLRLLLLRLRLGLLNSLLF